MTGYRHAPSRLPMNKLKSLLQKTQLMLHPVKELNVTVSGENAEQQCVAMRLCALIYNKITKITSVDNMEMAMYKRLLCKRVFLKINTLIRNPAYG